MAKGHATVLRLGEGPSIEREDPCELTPFPPPGVSTTVGTKPAASSPLDLPDAVSACDTLGAALAAATGLSYSPGACRAVTASYKWFVPERTAGSDVMYT